MDDLELARTILAEQRRNGVSFESAWATMLDALPAPAVRRSAADRERDQALTALEATRVDWQLAYQREPPRRPPYRARAVAARGMMARAAAA